MIMNCANVIAACCFWYAWLALWWWLRLGDNNHGYYCDVEDPCFVDGDGGCCWDVAVDCELMWRCLWWLWWRAWRLRCLFGNMICILCLPIFCIWNDDNCNKCGMMWWTASWKITAIMAMIEMALWRYCLQSACSDGAAFCRLVVGFEDGFFNLMRGMVAAAARMFLSVLGMRCLCCAILLGMLELTSRRSWIWLSRECVFVHGWDSGVAANELHLSMDLRFVIDVLPIAYLCLPLAFGVRMLMATLICMSHYGRFFDAWVVELNILYWSLFSRCDRLGCSAYSSYCFAFLKCFNCWALSCWTWLPLVVMMDVTVTMLLILIVWAVPSAARHLVLHCSFAVLDVAQLRVGFVVGFSSSADARGVWMLCCAERYMSFRLCWFDFGVNFLCFCAIFMPSIQFRVHWWMIWWVMNDCNVKAHVRVLICVHERRDSWMALTPCCGSCIPQPRFKPHALACFAHLDSCFCLWWRWWSWWLQRVHCWRRMYVTARLSCIHVICICVYICSNSDACKCMIAMPVFDWLRAIAFEHLHALHCIARETLLVIVNIWRRWQLFAKISWNFIQTIFRFIFCSIWTPPLFFLQNHISFCCLERWVPVRICYAFEQYFWVYRQWL